MSDAIVFNSLERALSSDINNLQAMATRQLADELQTLFAKRFRVLTGGSDDTLPRSVTGGLAIRTSGGGTQIDLLGGLLAQFNTTWPAVPGPLESAMRLGFNRSVLTTALSGTPNQGILLEARVVDVVTVNTVRDVFDVPTQTFIPTPVDKQTERQVEVQLVEVALPATPGFSGGSWVPLWGFFSDGAGLVDLSSGAPIDYRPDMQDVLAGSDQVSGSYSADIAEGVVTQASINTARPTASGDTTFTNLGGDFSGRIGTQQYRLRSQGANVVPLAASGFVPAAATIAHVYLLPLISAGIETAPWMSASASILKGVLHLSDVQPANGGRVNSAAITPNVAAYPNHDPVPAGQAMYLGSVYQGVASGFRYMTQTGGGAAILSPSLTPLNGVVSATASPGAGGSAVEALDLRGIVPDAARMVKVLLRGRWGALVAGSLTVSIESALAAAGAGSVGAMIIEASAADQFNRGELMMDVPVFHDSANNDDKNLEIQIAYTTAGTWNVDVDVVGWSL